jgi:hypothetical protein
MADCNICKRPLDVPGDRRTVDCGGDCAQCTGEAGDPAFAHLVGNGRAREEVWTCQDGRKVPVGEMDEAHVRDVLRMVIRRARKGEQRRKEKARVVAYLEKMAAEDIGEDRKWGRS